MTKRDSSFKTFVHRNERWLTIVGGFVVLATFVVKDVVRENMRELIESISGAENTLRVRTQFLTVRKELKAIGDRIGAGRQVEFLTRPPEDAGRQLYEEDMKLHDYGAAIAEELENLDDVIGKVWLTAEDRKNYSDIHHRAEALLQAIDQSRGRTLEEMIATTKRRNEEARAIEEQLLEGTDGVMSAARIVGAVRERRYRYVNWASYTLLSIGAIMSLLGRLYGVVGVKEEG